MADSPPARPARVGRRLRVREALEVALPRRLPHELTRAHHELELERDRQDEDHHPHERGAAQLLRVVGVEE